jgi:hypothetical protein
MKLHSPSADKPSYGMKFLILVLIIAILSGLVSGALSAMFFARPGPEGPAGSQGMQGPAGSQGQQGMPGTNGINSILQIVQNRNDTARDTSSYSVMQWFNMSQFDASMKTVINIQQNSKVFAQFSMVASLDAPGSLWARIVVDNNLNSTVAISSVGPPSAGIYKLTSHIEFLTDPLSSGQHSVQVQFLRESGSPMILDRTLTVMELISQ